MYKKFFMGIAAMAALTLVSCSSEDLNSLSDNSSKNEAISFDGYLGRSAVAVNGSRGSVVDLPALKSTELDKKGFGVFGYYNSSTTDHSVSEPSFDANLFNNERVTCLKDGVDWTYSPLKYWPAQGHIDFYAYAPYETGKTLNKKTSATSTTTTPTFNFTVANNVADQTDLLWAKAENKTKDNISSTDNKVKFQFAHALSRLGYTVKLKDASYASVATITLKRIALAGSANENTKAFYTKATIDLSKTSTATGLWSDYAVGRQNFEWFSGSHTVTTDINPIHPDENRVKDGDYLFVIPQKFKTGTDHLYVIVEYTIEYKSGTAKPTVSYKVSQELPYDFEQGKAYTINLTIGLTPIEFDAAVTGWDPTNGTPIDINSWN